MSTKCEYYEENGRHSFTAAPDTERDRNGDPIDMVCRYCPEAIHNENAAPRMDAVRTWEAFSAGHIFAEDINSDGTLKTETN